jgi:Glycosyl transferase family 2
VISVLTPSRGRPISLCNSIASLLNMASAISDIEVLVAADPDDDSTLALDNRVLGSSASVHVVPERWGYDALHQYYNYLASVASGDWLLLWNDDALMKTPSWDTVIQSQQPAVLSLEANHGGGANFFPAWPKMWTDACGHVSLSPNVDLWLGQVADMIGKHNRIPVRVHHDRFDVTGGHKDQTYDEGRGVLGSYSNHVSHDAAENREARARDAEIIRKLLV